MTADADFTQIFATTDLLIVVDEWKSEREGTEPELFVGRGFTNVGRSTLDLYRILVSEGAAAWHASGDRSQCQCLLTSPAFASIMNHLGRADTCLYEHLFHDLAHFDRNGAADSNWRRITLANRALAEIWSPRAPRQARAIFWFVECLLRCLAPRLGREIRVRVIVDRQDWLTARASRSDIRGFGFAHLGGRDDEIHAEVLAIVDKDHPSVLPYMPFLGLVDSESWAFGKQLGLRLPDGTRAHDRCIKWMRDGRGDSTELLHELNAAFDQAYADYANLNAYLHAAWNDWLPDRRVELESALD